MDKQEHLMGRIEWKRHRKEKAPRMGATFVDKGSRYCACMRAKPFTVTGECNTGFLSVDHKIAKWSAQR